MGLITRLRLEFDDSHVILRARAVLDHPATRLCKILEAIECGNDVVALALCEQYEVISLAQQHTNNNNNFEKSKLSLEMNGLNGIANNTHHECNGFFPNGKLLGIHNDENSEDEFYDEDMTMLMPTSMAGEAEAIVRFRQRLCDSSVAVFNYFLGGDLHIPQEVSFKRFQKALMYWDIEEDEISDCCLAHYNAEKSKRIVRPQLQAIKDKETYIRKTVRLPWTTSLGLVYGFASFCVVTFLFFFSFMGFEYMVSPEVEPNELCERYHGVLPQCTPVIAVKVVVSLAILWCLAEWIFCLVVYLAYKTGSLVILLMDFLVIIPYLIMLVLSFFDPPKTDFMIDFAKYSLSFHGFIFLKLCRYFPVIQRLLFTSLKFAKEVIQLLLLNYILSAILAFVAFYTEYMFAPDTSLFKSTFDAFWYAIVTLTTLGYGDYYQTEQYFAMLTMFLIVFPAILIQTLALIVMVRIISESLKSGLT